MAEISLFSSDQLVFVDETGFVCDTQYIARMQYTYKVYIIHVVRVVGCYYIKHYCTLLHLGIIYICTACPKMTNQRPNDCLCHCIYLGLDEGHFRMLQIGQHQLSLRPQKS